MNSAESWLKILLRAFGGTAALGIFPFLMPGSWMGVVHEWLRMGALPDKPIVEYLARYASAMSAFYGVLLWILATDVRRYSCLVTYQAIAMIVLSAVGAIFALRAGMPTWWILSDWIGCWSFCGAMVWLQRVMPAAPVGERQTHALHHCNCITATRRAVPVRHRCCRSAATAGCSFGRCDRFATT